MKKTVYWVLLLFWLALAMFLSRQTGEETAELSGTIAQWLNRLMDGIGIPFDLSALHHLLRHAAHVLIYLVLGFLMYRAFRLSFQGAWVLPMVLVLCVALGVLDEYQKSFIPGRHLHWDDVMRNGAGAVVGVVLGFLIPLRSKEQ